MRVIKDPDERKSEILDTAEALFTTKGYSKTTILDILNAIGIAKGTFYYHFKSKEEVMDAIIKRIVDADVAAARSIAANPDIPVRDKLFRILMAQMPVAGGSKAKLLEQFHQPSNAEMHQKSLAQAILHLTPVLADVIKQGIRENIFATDYPRETVEFLVAGAQVIFDKGLFHWEPHEELQKARAFIHMTETTLGAGKGSFDPILDLLTGGPVEG
ncbi:TetR/AcrR family transcriptional regulator [Paenibacillus filicis]|uniref:TetR/AcrR family transcriptional regulator n=1 Tax=Paenibacillus filicis TaxID=669464 RepID=A0ABU9DEA2_9BACL